MENKKIKNILESKVTSYTNENFNTQVFQKLKKEKRKTIEKIHKPRKVFADRIVFLLLFITAVVTPMVLIQGDNLLALCCAICGILIILYMLLSNILLK